MTNFFHRLFNPHCSSCYENEKDNKICQSCETLKTQLDISNFEKKQLLERLLNPIQPEKPEPVEYEPIPNKNVPWNVRRQMLEAEDREKAKLMRAAPKSTEILEKELGINQEVN